MTENGDSSVLAVFDRLMKTFAPDGTSGSFEQAVEYVRDEMTPAERQQMADYFGPTNGS